MNYSNGKITRVRLVDIPPGKVRGKADPQIASVIANLQAGIGPLEALELEAEYSTAGGGQYLAGKVRKAIAKAGFNADVLVRETVSGKFKVYVTSTAPFEAVATARGAR